MATFACKFVALSTFVILKASIASDLFLTPSTLLKQFKLYYGFIFFDIVLIVSNITFIDTLDLFLFFKIILDGVIVNFPLNILRFLNLLYLRELFEDIPLSDKLRHLINVSFSLFLLLKFMAK